MSDKFSTIPPRRERIFLATTDSVVQAWFPETQSEIIRQIKLLTLLGYDVAIGAPFAWQSKHTEAAIQALSPLVEGNLIELMGREKVETASDHLKARLEDTKKLSQSILPTDSVFSSEIPSKTSLVVARNLDILSPLTARHGNVEENFIKYFLQDLSYLTNSPTSLNSQIRSLLPTKYSKIARNKAEYLSTRLIDLPANGHFSRASIYISAADNDIPNQLINTINFRSTTLYHAANAVAYGAKLFTWANIALSVPKNISFAHQYSIAPENPYLFLETLKIFGVSSQVIDNISPEDIIRLSTDDAVVKEFVQWYKKFIAGCEVTSGNYADSISDAQPIMSRISRQREQTVSSTVNRNIIINEEKSRLSWYVGALQALVSFYFDAGVFTAISSFSRAKRYTDSALNIFRNQCEKSINKPLGDFEALIIREGLRDMEPLKCSEDSPCYHQYESNVSFLNERLRPFF